ncbi:putative lipoprotein [Liberibacter crescens BT-1]|uniref:Putative lipoprotein n=1 Tax=Liberibacter crescens (strain BT-1) TaxID=1215343 RepID=L0ESS0_LIBCB|nr:hypothetical protein [Liberibacter crescens]AGA64549.1 putative lipoprotein [Liberibacter crescens BT-1]AMC12695.1 hypothetical protein RL73_02895 [Liberibacter crescens]
MYSKQALLFSMMSITSILLSSCKTITPEEQRAYDESKCYSYGFKAKTEGFASCMMKLDLDRRSDYRAQRIISAESMRDPFYGYGRMGF